MKRFIPVFVIFALYSTIYAQSGTSTQTFVSPTAWLETDAEWLRIGDTLRISLKAFVEEPLVSWQMYLDWNPDLFAFCGAAYNASALPNFSAQNFAGPAQLMEDAQASISWFDNTFQGVTLDSGAVIIDVFLEAIDCGLDTLEILNAGFLETEILSTGPDGIYELDITEVGDTMDISCDTTDILLYLPDTTFTAADTTCIPVRVDHFEEVVGFLFPLSFDPEDLAFVEFRHFNPLLPQFGENSVGTLLQGDAFSNYRVFYTHPQLLPQTLPDSSVLFAVCFTPATDNPVCSAIGFRDVFEGNMLTEFVDANDVLLFYELEPSQARVAGLRRDTLCEGESLSINGQVFDQERPEGTVWIDNPACDSLPLELRLTFLPADTTSLYIDIFAGETYQVGDESFSEAGNYEVLLTNQLGCDSLVYLNLDVLTAAAEATSTLSLDEWSLQQLLDDAPTRFPENELRLFDALGRQVYYAQPYDGRPLNITTLPSGVYYYTFRPAVGKRKVLRGATVIAR